MRQRQFWVVSPNVNGSGSGTLNQWLEVIPREKAAFMGYGPKARKRHGRGGEWFADRVNEQDIVLVAHGRKRFVVGWGIVVSKPKKERGVIDANDGSPLHYQMRRNLAPFKSKPQFPDELTRHIPGYNGGSTHAIYKFNERKVGQKEVCDWLERNLKKPRRERPIYDDALREEPPPKKAKLKGEPPSGSGSSPPPPDAKLGTDGELLVYKYEKARLLAAGRIDLKKRVRHVAIEKGGDEKGYDILSFNPANGAEIRIEVKTTRGAAASPFYLTRREVRCSEQHPGSYYLYRVYRFGQHPPLFYRIRGRLRDNFGLEPTEYRAHRR